jgi:tetratricopeptide (TPR) repeat protein
LPCGQPKTNCADDSKTQLQTEELVDSVGSEDFTHPTYWPTQFSSGIRINPPTVRVTLARDYELLSQLGRGGMGIVYLAYQQRLKRKVAYKVLTQLGYLDSEALERFQGEAEVLAKLQHPNIVAIYDYGAWHDTPYIAMEYLPGGSLAEKLRRQRPSPRESAQLIVTITRAIGHAHSQNIIHRDLNPGNILLTIDGQPKVSDFGLARDLASERLTRTGMIAGTPQYMAPEQIIGSKDLTPAVDVWAIGAIFCEMLTGTVPFAGSEPHEIFSNVLSHHVVSIRAWQPGLSRDLETICMKCLQREPERRYASANELADDLQRFLDGCTILARPAGKIEKTVRWCRRNPLVAGLTFGIALLLVAATIVSLALAQWALQEQDRTHRAADTEMAQRHKAELAFEAEKKALADQTKAREEAEVMTSVLNSLLKSVQPGKDTLGGLRNQLDKTAAELKVSNYDSVLKAKLFYTVAMTRRHLGDYDQALDLMRQSFALRKEHLGDEHPDTRKTAHELCYTYIHHNNGEEAIRVFKPTFDLEVKLAPPDSEEMIYALDEMRRACAVARRFEEEKELGDRIVAICQKRFGDDAVRTHWIRVTLAYPYQEKKYDVLIPMLEKALRKFRKECAPDSAEVLWTQGTLAYTHLDNNQPGKAVEYLQPIYEHDVERNGENHPLTLRSRDGLARAYERAGRPADAIPLRRSLHEYYQSIGNQEAAKFHEKLISEDLAEIRK